MLLCTCVNKLSHPSHYAMMPCIKIYFSHPHCSHTYKLHTSLKLSSQDKIKSFQATKANLINVLPVLNGSLFMGFCNTLLYQTPGYKNRYSWQNQHSGIATNKLAKFKITFVFLKFAKLFLGKKVIGFTGLVTLSTRTANQNLSENYSLPRFFKMVLNSWRRKIKAK